MADKIRGITIELGGDASGLSKALKGVNSEIKDTQSQLRDVERLLKLDPGNVKLLEQKQRLLNESTEEYRTKLENLKKAQENFNKETLNTKEGQAAWDALNREIISTEDYLAKAEKKASGFNATLESISAKAQEVGEKLENAGEKISGVGEKMLPVTAAVGAVGVATGKMALDFEDAIAKVSTIADATEVPIDSLRGAILDLSNETGIAASDIADNVYNAISAGQSTGDAVAFVANATKLARAGFTDSASALDILTTVMNAYGLEASEVDKVSNNLITTQNLGKTTVAELASSMGKVIPTAKSVGLNFDELSAAYAVMTSNGIATAETTTYLNSMLNELGKEGTTAADAFREGTKQIKEGGLSMAEAMEMGWSLTDVTEVLAEQATITGTSINNMFGSAEAGKAAAVLWDQGEKLRVSIDAMGESAGATDEAFAKLDTTSYTMEKTINEVKNAGIELGTTLLNTLAPTIGKVIDAVHRAVEWFASLDDEQKNTILTVAAVVAAIGPLLVVIGKVTSAVGTITGTVIPALGQAMSWLMANPMAALVVAIVALVALIATKGDEIQALLQKLDDWLQNIFARDWTEIFGPVLGNILNGFMATVKNVWDGIKQIFDGVIDFIRGVFTGDWSRAWNGVKEIFSGVFGALSGIASGPINAVIGIVNGAIDSVNWLIQKINAIPFVNIPTIGKMNYFAKGGSLTDGGTAIVGEAGPELLTVQGGRAIVTPLGGNMGGTTNNSSTTNMGGINLTINGAPGQDVRELADLIMDEMQAAVNRKGAVFA